jgi:hypothetical protein
MNSKLISEKALAVIDQYAHFRIHGATTAIPYFNNNHKRIRAALRATTGKGSPRDIFDETEIMLVKEGQRGDADTALTGAVNNGSFKPGLLTSESLRHFLVDQDIGIDCSGFAYHVLSAESAARKKGTIDRHLRFPFCKGIVGKIRCKMRPVENADVRTFASDKNSRVISLGDVMPGDIITMLGKTDETNQNIQNSSMNVRDHIVVITQVEYQNFIPIAIHYAHSIAWPSDGEYGHGVRDGLITIADINKPLPQQIWTEAEKTGAENYTLARALKSATELRRLNWF